MYCTNEATTIETTMSNSIERNLGDGKVSTEVKGKVLHAVAIAQHPIKDLLDSGVKLLIVFTILTALCAIFFYFMDMPGFRSPLEILQFSLEMLGSALLFILGLLSLFSWPAWFKYRRLIQEGVLTQGVITQYLELPEPESNTPIPHIVYHFEGGAATLQKVGGRYRIGLPIPIRYVPTKPHLSRAELPE